MNYRQAVNRGVNFWFHTPKKDSISPAETVHEWNNKFLEGLQYRKFSLAISEKNFRKYMCEALCVMFLAKKEDKDWRGPISEMPRPERWNQSLEMEWIDLIESKYLGYEFFESVWCHFREKAIWENAIPDWRISFELIALHYIAIDANLLYDWDNNMDCIHLGMNEMDE